MREFLRELSSEPHIAAGRRDRELTAWIQGQWQEAGLELVSLAEYDFLLSYPNSSQPNKVNPSLDQCSSLPSRCTCSTARAR